MPPSRLSFGDFAIVLWAYIEFKPFHIKGGSQALSNTLLDAYLQAGGDVRFNCGASEILVADGRTTGVVTETGDRIDTGHVVSNASTLTTYVDLIDKAHVPEGREVFPFLTVAENLAMGAYNRRDNDAVAADTETVYGYFPALRELRGKMAAYLSGGQQQMLAIGRGFMSRPRLLMLDEPSLGLSPLLIQEIFAIIARLNREQGMTILLVEQNANVALQVSNRGYVMEVGGMVMDGKSADLLESEDIKEFYLGKKEEGIRGRRRWKKRKTWR